MRAQRNEMQWEIASGLIKSKSKLSGLRNSKLNILVGIGRGTLYCCVSIKRPEREYAEIKICQIGIFFKEFSEGSSDYSFLEIRCKMFSSLLWEKSNSGKTICSGFTELCEKKSKLRNTAKEKKNIILMLNKMYWFFYLKLLVQSWISFKIKNVKCSDSQTE